MQRPAIPTRGIIINKPIEAPPARIEAVLRILVFDRGLVPAQPTAVLAIPVRVVVLVEALQHFVLPLGRFGGRRHV